jgi:hypothetical protein
MLHTRYSHEYMSFLRQEVLFESFLHCTDIGRMDEARPSCRGLR